MERNTVFVVHAIDTEGPLYESIRANFERVYEIFGHEVEPSKSNLEKLQAGDLSLDGDEEKIARVLSGKRIQTNGDWQQITTMLDRITSDEFRTRVKDSTGAGWIYNWLCMSHVGFTGENPRRRDIGYHNIMDAYNEYFDQKDDDRDLIGWHYHPLSLTNDAHRCGSTYLNSDHIYSILCRYIIDRNWFPSVFRAGHVTQRPDSHFFLEQWIPFDFSNSSHEDQSESYSSTARFGDWSRASRSWIPYQPHHDDYQSSGNCRRYIARCLPIDERAYTITSEDVAQAFSEAQQHGASILSVTNHDFRDMQPDVEKVMDLLKTCSSDYPDVDFRYARATDAMRAVTGLDDISAPGLTLSLDDARTHMQLNVESANGVFGPQPFLAIKTRMNTYHWQNLDFEGDKQWSYSFDAHNITIEQVDKIGIAANTSTGVTEVVTLDASTGRQKKKVLHN